MGSQYDFPWKVIDDSNIEAQGFIRETFAFHLDQDRILELLTGHTLYNDTDVVIRELVQNSLDAVRLRAFRERQSQSSLRPGRVIVGWDPQHRAVTVQDNGTGMTQAIIEKHLLRVGSSFYQDPEFRKENPEFSSISRFGIGVLSAFMVADAVEITTIHPDEEKARQLSLRSVHGRYLVRLFEKDAPEVKDIGSSGTPLS